MNLTLNQIARFRRKYTMSDTCWVWTGGLDKQGRGQIKIAGRVWSARDVAWRLHGGEQQPGKRLVTTCGNPLCVRPVHLRLEDAKKLRKAAKESSKRLTPDQRAALIQDSLRTGVTLTALGRLYRVSTSTAGRLVRDRHLNTPTYANTK